MQQLGDIEKTDTKEDNQTLVSLSSSIAMSFLVAEVACAENDDEIKAQLLSSLFVMNGIATFVCVIFGIRLPLFQGSAGDYVVPLLAIMTLDPDRCSKQKALVMAYYGNETLGNITSGNGTFSAFIEKEVIMENLRVI
ncbi:hypothetical protein KUTeg_018600 [Tegillarca granosa]|uniref:Uncharacterized protein n=1 Tax=Tegillarca granosa TaxID=220873 RepID=A0ABQ9EIA1_TEGGR|nr:hypothetical protein KUTeg_018600 [Tegillarca granosa]